MGGSEQAYANVTEALAARGHKVTALLRADAPYRAAIAAHAAIHTVQPLGFYDMRAAWKVRRLLKKLQPDIILAHNARAISLLFVAAFALDIPVCGVTHGYKTLRTTRADALIVLTEHMRAHFIAAGYPAERLEVVPNLVRLPEKPQFKKPGSPIVIGAIGRFAVEKGFADLLAALQLLNQSGVDFTARIAGEGPELEHLKVQIQSLGLASQVRLEGWVKDKAAFYKTLDILCVPSREESFGLVMIDAMAHGVPVVATDAPGPASIIKDGESGLLAPRENPAALAAALQKLATHPDMAAWLAEAGWHRVKDYDFPVVAKKWDEVLTGIISAAKTLQAT